VAAKTDVGESAVIIPVEVPVPIRRLRDRMDASAALGVPAHVTLLYPFVAPAALDDAVRAELGRIIGTEVVFPFALRHVERWPNVVYLPPEPSDPFSRLIRALATAYPDYPPYGGAHALADIVPHLTVAQSDRTDYLDAAAHALPGLLPVRDVCREAWLIAHDAGERWRTVWRLPLSASGLGPGGPPVRG
jgi:2'-5' RNA ligase